MDRLDNEELKEWSQNQPLSILRLDPIDRAILKISGTKNLSGNSFLIILYKNSHSSASSILRVHTHGGA
jgi:hypothetical protein